MTSRMQELLDRIRDDVREAVLEGDAQDCSSADCIADATYEIVRFALRDYLLVSEADLAAALDGLIFDLPIGEDVTYSRGYSSAVAALRESLRHDLFAALGAAQEKGT